MKKAAAAIILVILCFSPVNSPAQVPEKSFYLSPMIGGYTFDGGQNLETTPVIGLRAGYNFTKQWGVEGLFDYASPDGKHGQGGADFYRYGLDALWYFQPMGKLVPYVAAGLSGMRLNGPHGSKNSDGNFAAVGAGAGVNYFLGDYLALRADVRDIVKFDNTQNNIEYMVGLVIYFGGEKKTVARAAPAEPVVAQAPEKARAPEKAAAPAPPAEAPAPKPEVKEKIVEFNMLPVFFDYNKSNIRPDAERTLKRNLKWFELNPGKEVRVEATCDTRGSAEYNKKLAKKRADAVKSWLVKHGINGNLLIPTVIGKVDAFSGAKTEQGYQMNRRVQLVPAR